MTVQQFFHYQGTKYRLCRVDGFTVHNLGSRYCRQCWPPRGRGRGEDRYSPRRLASKQKAWDACDLWIVGTSFAQIARTLGYADRSGAYRAVHRALGWLNDPDPD